MYQLGSDLLKENIGRSSEAAEIHFVLLYMIDQYEQSKESGLPYQLIIDQKPSNSIIPSLGLTYDARQSRISVTFRAYN